MDPLSSTTRTTPFPPDAAVWLAGQSGRTVVLVGDPASTRVIHEALAALGYDVRGSEDGTMSLPDRSVDAIVAVDRVPDLQVAARVLRPGGQVAVVAHEHDQRIPWVRKLANAVRIPGAADPLPGMTGSPYFGHPLVETFRFWQVVTRDGLAEVVRGLPTVLARSHSEQERAVSDALDLYDDYGRGPDGMQLPWVSHCYRAPVLAEAWALVTEQARAAAEAAELDERTARAAARAVEQEALGDEQPDHPEDARHGGPVDPLDLAQSIGRDERAAADRRDADDRAAHLDDTQPFPGPRSDFDLGDTMEGVITYVVDTGEMAPVRAELAPRPTTPRPTVPRAPAAPARPARSVVDEPDDPAEPDLLIRFD
ncbi:class I SAM-dependent methyltransferase [Nocardioides alkalitolerans]|uniref:class I SAM-dependent methyltransferase n=1 Tax=Nocardioides alkalitolerans TaxID=281714 RepID=UPI0003F868A7|nr:class I SAM-dependent methyltransferase [Nocardioides alkalitolerans]